MAGLQRTLKRVIERRSALESAESVLREIDDEYRSGNDAADEHAIDLSTTTGLKEIRVTAHWYAKDRLEERLAERLHSDVWDTATLYRGGGHAESKPKRYEYHLVAEREISLSEL